MKKIKNLKLKFKKQVITNLTESTINGGYMAAFATQSDQQQTGCQTNCQASNVSCLC